MCIKNNHITVYHFKFIITIYNMMNILDDCAGYGIFNITEFVPKHIKKTKPQKGLKKKAQMKYI